MIRESSRSKLRRLAALTVFAAIIGFAVVTASLAARGAKTKDPFIAQAKAVAAAAVGAQTKWNGPTTGPTSTPGKKIVCVEYLASDVTAVQWCAGASDAAKAIGWKVSVLDGKGTTDGQRAALQQAVALKPDGIVLSSVDGASQKGPIGDAAKAGISVVGIHSAGRPGPYPALHLFTNISQEAKEIGGVSADYAIANSNGTAQAIVIYDALYAIARLKATSFKNELAKCKTCKLLQFDNSPVAQAPTRMPTEFSAWLQKYTSKFYVYSVSDYWFDQAAPALRTGGIPPQGRVALLGSDGSPAAYERIKKGQWELETAVEPVRFEGWQAVDELNRAFHKQKPSGYYPGVHLITKANIARDLAKGYYDPANKYQAHYKGIWGVK